MTALPETIHVGEKFQTNINDHERVAPLERELALVYALLASETLTRRVLEDQLNSVRAIV